MSTKIDWTDETWNPITGCTPISEGCEHCYAVRMAQRLAGRNGYPADDPFRPGVEHDSRYGFIKFPKIKKSKRIFVSSMGDLFHDAVGVDSLNRVFRAVIQHPQHTYYFLTKRPQNMSGYLTTIQKFIQPNWWFGTSIENQRTADERIPILLSIPGINWFISVEPMLGPVNLTKVKCDLPGEPPDYHYMDLLRGGGQQTATPWKIHWVICGGETGPHARPIDLDWVRSLRDQCQAAGVPFWLKSLGPGQGDVLDGRQWKERP